MFEFSKYIDTAAAKLANARKISFDEAFNDISERIFNSDCDVLRELERHIYPQQDVDYVW